MNHSTRRIAARIAAALGAGAVLALAAPLAASAHVTVAPNQAAPGSYTLVDVKVPTESDTASTTKLVVDLPTDTPILSVMYVPVPGWTAKLTTEQLPKPVTSGDDTITRSVTHVTWTADSAADAIPPGAMGVFPLSLGPIPDTGSLRFPAHQSYSDGSVVDWAGTGESAEHPAPTLFVNDAPTDSHGGASASAEPHSASGDSAASSDSAATGQDVVARGLGVAGLVVGVVGVVVAVVATTRRRPTA